MLTPRTVEGPLSPDLPARAVAPTHGEGQRKDPVGRSPGNIPDPQENVMNDPLAYQVARAREREIERIVNRPDRLMGEELRLGGRSGRRRRRRHRT